MASFSPKLAFVLFFVVVPLQTMASEGNGEQREIDSFILALFWPSTLCSRVTKCCAKNGCCRGAESPTGFTIHGLWPRYNDKSLPSCCTDKAFDPNEISTLTEDLEKYWPTFNCGKPSTCHKKKGSFWAHEFENHGTCAAPIIVGEHDYFLTTITIYSKHNVTEVLNDAGIVASDTKEYPIGDVIAAVKNAYNVSPKLSCTKKGAVKELWLCFNKNFELRDCEYQNTCPDLITFPTYEPKSLDSVHEAIPWVADAEAF